MEDEAENGGVCSCLQRFLTWFGGQIQYKKERAVLASGGNFIRKSTRLAFFGSKSEEVTVKLSEASDTVLKWRLREAGDDSNTSAGNSSESGQWHELDIMDIKLIDKKGDTGFSLISKTGDLLIQLECPDTSTRNAWVGALEYMTEELRRNPQLSEAHKSLADRVKESAQKQKYFAQRGLELQQQKKEAEVRKGNFLKEAGGLKYTAIAMASRS